MDAHDALEEPGSAAGEPDSASEPEVSTVGEEAASDEAPSGSEEVASDEAPSGNEPHSGSPES